MAEKDDTFFGGLNSNGNQYVLVIDGAKWNFNRNKYLNDKMAGVAIGERFDIDSSTNDKGGLSVEWDTFRWGTGRVPKEIYTPYVVADAAGKKAKTVKTSYNKLKQFDDLTLSEIRDEMWQMSKAARTATLARIMEELL